MNYQLLTQIKNSATIEVSFEQGLFKGVPVVLIAPIWTSPVGEVDYLTSVSSTQCMICGSNAAPDYYVNVIALDAGNGSFGTLNYVAGVQAKSSFEVKINLQDGPLKSPEPVQIISSFWPSGTGGLGAIDTVDDSAASEFSVVSANLGSGYKVLYLALDIGIGEEDGKLLQTGIANKTGIGTMRVYFTRPFSEPPTVFLTPWWNDRNAGVGENVDTLVLGSTTNDYFEFVSAHRGEDFFVNWMALGPS